MIFITSNTLFCSVVYIVLLFSIQFCFSLFGHVKWQYSIPFHFILLFFILLSCSLVAFYFIFYWLYSILFYSYALACSVLFCSVLVFYFMFVYVVLVLSVLFYFYSFIVFLFYSIFFSSYFDLQLCLGLFYSILQLCVDLLNFEQFYSILFNHILVTFILFSLVMLFWSIQFYSFNNLHSVMFFFFYSICCCSVLL